MPARGGQGDVARVHPHLRVENHDALDEVLQLAHVARPVMLGQHFIGFRGQLFGLAAVGRGELAQEMIG